ncbi:MAG: trigger factor [Desulfobacteraceae bacterium]|nr:trigger factor [Desulfobacteraceae bacterium]
MQVNVEELSSVKKVLHIEISEAEIASELDEAYKNLRKTVKVKGFRPGKAPRSVLEGMYKKQVNADVSSKLIQESFENAVKDNNLSFIGSPQIDPPEFEGKGPYKYDVTLENSPEIGEIEFKNLKLKKNLYKVNDDEITAQLGMFQRKLAQYNIINGRPVKDGDFAVIDYEGFKDGKPFEETQKTENFMAKVQAGQIFEEKLIGMESGSSKEVTITFPENYSNKKLAGVEINFHITLKEIREEVLPEIDNDFAKQLGSYETLDDLKNEINNNLKQGYERRSEQELYEQIFQQILEKQQFEVPDIMVGYELEGIVREAELSLAYHNTTIEERFGITREEFAEKYSETAVDQVKRHLVLARLIEQEKLAVSDEDLENGMREIGQPLEEIKNYYEQNKDKLEILKSTILEKQAVKLVIDNSDMEETEVVAQAG